MDRERVLIDTSILIDHLRRGNKERSAFYQAAQRFDCVVSAITEFEFRVGSTAANQDFVAALQQEPQEFEADACVLLAVKLHETAPGCRRASIP